MFSREHAAVVSILSVCLVLIGLVLDAGSAYADAPYTFADWVAETETEDAYAREALLYGLDATAHISGSTRAVLPYAGRDTSAAVGAGFYGDAPPTHNDNGAWAWVDRPGLSPAWVLRVNVADATQLDALPGIGDTLAGRIIDARAAGPFVDGNDLSARVRGIGAKTVERLAPYVSYQ